MNTLKHLAVFFLLAATLTAHAGTILYTYDESDRLTGVNYNNQATESYDYDRAGNLTVYNVLTGAELGGPFMIYFTLLHGEDATRELLAAFDATPRPLRFRG